MVVQSKTMGVSIKFEDKDFYFPVNQPVEVTQNLGLILLAKCRGYIMRLDKPIWKPGDRVQWFNKDTQQTGHILDLLDLDDDSWQLAMCISQTGSGLSFPHNSLEIWEYGLLNLQFTDRKRIEN